LKRRKQRGEVIVPVHRKMPHLADQHQNDGETDDSDQATQKNARRNGVLRMISPPRAFSAGYGF
jgi:hypothetical protein